MSLSTARGPASEALRDGLTLNDLSRPIFVSSYCFFIKLLVRLGIQPSSIATTVTILNIKAKTILLSTHLIKRYLILLPV